MSKQRLMRKISYGGSVLVWERRMSFKEHNLNGSNIKYLIEKVALP